MTWDSGFWNRRWKSTTAYKKGFSPLRFSINLSVVQFRKKEFVPDFKKIIEESGVNPNCIELEITESLLAENPADVIEKLYQLKELGVKIAIDDFGRGTLHYIGWN